MSLTDAVIRTGVQPTSTAIQADKKRYSEILSSHLAREVAAGLRKVGFLNTKPLPGGPGERAFQGGLGPKKVDVSYSDEQHGLLLAVSIKTICFPPFGKNLKNRFADLCTEAITLHMRFPYSVVCALFAFPEASNLDTTQGRTISTFQRAARLLATVNGRRNYTGPGEQFENVTMMLFQPYCTERPIPSIRLVDTESQTNLTEQEYFFKLHQIYNTRNPHALIVEEFGPDEVEDDE